MQGVAKEYPHKAPGDQVHYMQYLALNKVHRSFTGTFFATPCTLFWGISIFAMWTNNHLHSNTQVSIFEKNSIRSAAVHLPLESATAQPRYWLHISNRSTNQRGLTEQWRILAAEDGHRSIPILIPTAGSVEFVRSNSISISINVSFLFLSVSIKWISNQS
jgi:hypothetical protein